MKVTTTARVNEVDVASMNLPEDGVQGEASEESRESKLQQNVRTHPCWQHNFTAAGLSEKAA